ncbi:MAG: hypothetical protein GY832_41580 [Chloroflexi bacterium]|nr:hypothetical protein [Chloroflexota bacterium]
MDPFITTIIVILGKYALDKGVELGTKVGPKALDTAKEMFQIVMERVKGVDPRTAEKYPENPQGYQAPVKDILADIVQANAEFAAQLKTLLAQYDKEAQANAVETGTTYEALLDGSGAIAQGKGAVAAGEGGIAIGGNVGGDVIAGGHKKPSEKEDKAAT